MNIVKKCEGMVEKIYQSFDASHDMDHILRVLANGEKIIQKEKDANWELVQLGILLHDIDDPKYAVQDVTALSILQSLDIDQSTSQEILANIAAVSFSGGNEQELPSIEAAIMRDADRLDAIGAVGIARAFAFGGAKGHKLYNLQEEAREQMTEADYRQKEVATVTHFHEKLLKVKDLMVTTEGKRLAEERHHFMVAFLHQLSKEIQ